MRINRYEVYAFDITNKLKTKENGTYTVQVLEKKRRFLKPSIYRVISLQTQEIFWVDKSLLTPVPINTSINTYVRYPEDTPVIISRDAEIINFIVSITNPNESYYNDLCKLQIKINYYLGAKDI